MSRVKWYTGRLLPFLSAVLVALLAYFSPVSNTNSDPQFGLLVAQTMLRYQTVKMDVYRETFAPILDRAFVTIGDHLYYYFPLGTPVLSIPVVGAANLLGFDMADAAQEAVVQNFISAVLVGLAYLVIYLTCRCFLPIGAALLITTTCFLGSALISTMSTALWSIDFTVLFVALTLLVLARQAAGKRQRFQPYLLGGFLFGAYLCRPSTFLFVALVLGYLLLVDRRTFWPTAVTAAILLAGFLIFIRAGYGSWLPPYYNDFGRLAVERRPLYEAFFGNLISPSRGLFVYSPVFLLTLIGAFYFYPQLKRRPLFNLIMIWFFLQLLLVARTTRWWGGLSFGPRILTEMLPGLVVVTALVAGQLLEKNGRKRATFLIAGLYTVFAVWAVFLNSYQALFNQYTAFWHSALTPNIDYEPDYLWRWDYPQFLADNEILCNRDRQYIISSSSDSSLVRKLYPYIPERPLPILDNEPFLIYEYLDGETETAGPASRPASQSAYLPFLFSEGQGNLDVLLSGWSNPQFGYRWSMCKTAVIIFKLHPQVDTNQSFELSLLSGSFGRQRVNVDINGTTLGRLVFDGPATPPISQTITIPPNVLSAGDINTITLNLPDAVIPDLPEEDRRLALAFVSFTIRPAPH